MAGNFKMNDDYIEVAERIALFKSAYPDGTLQPLDHLNPYVVQEVGGETLIVYAAAAYRTPDDPRPGVGVASEVFPGRTPYTKGSEVANAETSAWGRAIVALGIPSKHVATKEDVRNRQAEQGDAGKGSGADQQRERVATAEPAPNGNGGITRTQAEQLHAAIFSKGRTDAAVLTILGNHGIGDGVRFGSIPAEKFAHVLAQLSKLADPPPPEPTTPAAAPAPAESVSATDFTQPAPATQEAAQEVAAPAAASAASEPVVATQAAPAAQGGAEDDDGFDVLDEAIKEQAEKTAEPAGKAKRKPTVTTPQLTRLGALCASIEAKGVGEMEWRTYLETEEGVRSRTLLTKAAATRIIDRLNRWNVDLQTGVVGAKEGAAA